MNFTTMSQHFNTSFSNYYETQVKNIDNMDGVQKNQDLVQTHEVLTNKQDLFINL